jgi:hypothetical protein
MTTRHKREREQAATNVPPENLWVGLGKTSRLLKSRESGARPGRERCR